MATMPERIARLEERQSAHEEEQSQIMASLSVRIDKAQEVAQNAEKLATQVASSVEAMPSKIIEGIEGKQRGFRMEAKEWIMVALIVLSPFYTTWVADMIHPKPAPVILETRTGR